MSSAAVILAAGGSERFGGELNKLETDFRGRRLIQWAVDAAVAAALDETVVVTGSVDLTRWIPPGVTVLHNASWKDGLAGSLRVALDWCERRGHQAAVVGLGDQPLVPAEAWRAVATARDRPISVATYGGRRRNPVRLDRSVWSLVDVSGDEGARALMRRRPELVGEVACDGDPTDIDTKEDMQLWS